MEIDSIDQPIAESKATESKVAESELLLCDPAIIEQFKLPEDAASEAWRPDLLRYYLGRTLAFQGHYAAALEQLHIVAAHNASDPAVWVAIALACRGWLGPESTIDLTYFWQEALTRAENQPDSAPHLFNRAIIYELQGEWFEAREDYYKVVGMFNAGERVTYAARVGSARAGAKLGETSNASQLLKGAITVDSEAIWAYLEMARLYSEEPSNADRWLADAGKRAANHHYPGNRNLQLARADICRSRQDFACAAEAYKQALAHSPPSSWLHTRVGDFYRHEPRWELALIQYEAAAQLRESDPQVYANLGYARVANNDLQGAAEAYQQAIERSYPADDVTIEAYCGALAQIIEAGQLDESLAALERCRMES